MQCICANGITLLFCGYYVKGQKEACKHGSNTNLVKGCKRDKERIKNSDN